MGGGGQGANTPIKLAGGLSDQQQEWYQNLMDEVQFGSRTPRVPLPYRAIPGPQFDPKPVPIIPGPPAGQLYYEPMLGRGDAALLAQNTPDASFIQSMSAVPTGIIDPISWLQDEHDKQGGLTPQDLDRFHREQERLNEENRRRAMNELLAQNSMPGGPGGGGINQAQLADILRRLGYA